MLSFFFFFNDTATTEIYTLSLHDALPIYIHASFHKQMSRVERGSLSLNSDYRAIAVRAKIMRSEEHTSELQSLRHLVCRLLLEKKKNITSDVDGVTSEDRNAGDLHSELGS